MYIVSLIIINSIIHTDSKNCRLRDLLLTTLTFVKDILPLTSKISLVIDYFIQYKLVLGLGLM